MLAPAISSLKEIWSEINAKEPELLKDIQSFATVCVRYVRQSTERLSPRSFGTAIDLAFRTGQRPEPQLPRLAKLAQYFERSGWIWGGRWLPLRDDFHFEVGRELLEKWLSSGELTKK